MKNEISAHLTFDGVNKKGQKDHRDESAEASFVARPADRTWWDYNILMWQHGSQANFARLRGMGISGGQYGGNSRTPPDFLLNNDMRWYAENIATDFYSAYHKYFPDRPNHWAYLQAKELYKKDPASKEAFKRHPSFSDAGWTAKVHDRLVEAAKFGSPYRPLFYDLGDESGIADLAAYWDFDFSDEALAEMRGWLKARYGTLAALNRQWGSNFTAWDLVTPNTTDEAMKRTDDNYSSWADHKEFMDMCYARAIHRGVKAVESVDPDALVGVAGGQMPGWGGYDYYRLANALTAIEPYDIGNNIEILRSINPKLAVITTSFAQGPQEKHRVWYELLHGNRGMIIWDDRAGFIARDGSNGKRGEECTPYYNEIRGGIGALLINSVRQADPVAIHYSQASMRTEWMLAQKPKGAAWVDRSSSRERMDSDFLKLRESWTKLVEDQGLQYNFVAYAQVEQGELLKRGYRVLVLPHSSALSTAEAQAIREFVAQGGTVIADGVAGAYDEHSRKAAAPQLEDVAKQYPERFVQLNLDTLNYLQSRILGKEADVRDAVGKLIRGAGVRPAFVVTDDAGKPVTGVETQEFRNGAVRIVGLHSNPEMRVNELGPPEFKSNARFEKPKALRLALPAEMYAYDLRAGKALGRKREVSLTLDPFEPAVFAFSLVALPDLKVAAPARLAHGTTGAVAVTLAGTPAAEHVVHVEVVDPSGKVLPQYSGNLLAHEGRAAKSLPLAQNDAAGRWEVRVKDLLSGETRISPVDVY
jgi:hypothetical protein